MTHEPLTTGQVAEFCHVTYRAVLKWIAEGKLKAYRTPGQHSRISVPDFLEFLKKYNMPVPPELTQETSHKKILIVDDDRKIVELLKAALGEEKTYSLQVAYDGFSAGQKFSTAHPDLVILDINMPGMNGFEVCSQIRSSSENKNVRILAVSGVTGDEGLEKITKMGADDTLSKPFEIAVLKKKIEKLLGIKKTEENKAE